MHSTHHAGGAQSHAAVPHVQQFRCAGREEGGKVVMPRIAGILTGVCSRGSQVMKL